MAKKPTYEELEQRVDELGQRVEELENEFVKREQVEGALRKNEEKYRTLFEKSSDAIMITATDGRFVDVNQAALDLFDYTRNDLMDSNVRQLYVYPEERVKLQKELGQKDSVKDFELKFRRKDGTEMDCLATVTVRRDNDCNIVGYQGITRDVTKRKRAEDGLKRTSDNLGKTVEKLKDANRKIFEQQKLMVEEERLKVLLQMAGATAQELNQPLTAILGNIELMRIKEAIPERLADYISSIEASGKRMAEIVSRVQDVHHHDAKPDIAARSIINFDQEIYVLSVEESDEEFNTIVACLKGVGNIKVTRARDIEEALQLAERGLFDLILADYVLSDGSGLELMETLYKNKIETPVIVITAQGSEMAASQVIQAGGYDYMPLDMVNEKSLSRSISNVLEKARLKREIRVTQKKITEMAIRDELTGLFNRRYFLETLEREVARARRYDIGLLLCMIDLDHFKKVNDTYGHPAGDMVLSEVSKMLQECFRGTDIPCRYGGEEFAVILCNADLEGALIAAERFRELLAGHLFDYNGKKFQITVSIGIATYSSVSDQSSIELITAADQALYQAKTDGRNRIREAYESTKVKDMVLLVDDEEIILDIGKKLLSHIGYNVLFAHGGQEAIEVYRKNKESIDIVILDIVMPDMGGEKTYDGLREINPDVKVLLSSGYRTESEAKELLERGCDGFIQKPFDMAQLSHKIREILDKK